MADAKGVEVSWRTVRRAGVRAFTALALVAAGVAVAVPRATGSARPVAIRSVRSPATGQIQAHDGKLWLGSQPIVLKGLNFTPGSVTQQNLQQMASWGANFNRLTVHWAFLEPNPPVKNPNGTWTHTYDTNYLQKILDDVNWSYQDGIYSLIGNNGCSDDEVCTYFKYPTWLYKAQYNSHGVTYQETEDGKNQAYGDFWSDALRQQFQRDELAWLASKLKGVPGVMGYLVQNEPQQGYLDASHATTQLMLDVMLTFAKSIRAVDPTRVIVFATRYGYGPGLENADLSGWVNLAGSPTGNVAFDMHDYFGARWGSGLQANPSSSGYLEASQNLFGHVDEDQGPYIGTVFSHQRFLLAQQQRLARWGIPLMVCEFGDNTVDPGVFVYYGTVMTALDDVGISWVGWWGGHLGITNADGSLEPFAYLVINAF